MSLTLKRFLILFQENFSCKLCALGAIYQKSFMLRFEMQLSLFPWKLQNLTFCSLNKWKPSPLKPIKFWNLFMKCDWNKILQLFSDLVWKVNSSVLCRINCAWGIGNSIRRFFRNDCPTITANGSNWLYLYEPKFVDFLIFLIYSNRLKAKRKS